MDIAMLGLVFLASVAVAGCVVMAFTAPIDGTLSLLTTGELARAWSKYAKFALFVASFTSGLRLREIESVPLIMQPAAGEMTIELRRCLIEVFKSIAGALSGASWTLLVFFGASLGFYLALRLYHSLKPIQHRPAHPTDRHAPAIQA
jgi:hypothetical protein